MATDDEILDSPDGLNEAERAEFAQMQEHTSGDLAPIDPAAAGAADAGAGADAGADAGAEAAAAAAAAAGGDAGTKDAAAVAAAAAGKDGAAADAGADDDEDDGEADVPVVGADGKPVLAADGKPARRKARVSLKKYTTEKERADKLDADNRTIRESMARADERMRLINEALTTPRVDAKKQEEEQEPDPEADAFGWMKWGRNKIANLEKAITDIREGKQTEDGQRVVADAYTQDATQFAGAEPNFVPAYSHLMNSRAQELAMYFYGVDLTEQGAKLSPQQVNHIKSVAAEEERGIVENAISQNRSPAKAVYQMARYRGYVPQTKEQFEARRAAANGGANGATNGAAAGAGGKGANGAAKPAAHGMAAENGGKNGSVSDEIERIKAGSEASLSLSDGGGTPANPLTAQKLADMPEDQFNALMDRLDGTDPDAFRRLVEGQP